MTARKRTPATVSVRVVEPFAVFHDGQQRTGVLRNVHPQTAALWVRRGWATVNDDA